MKILIKFILFYLVCDKMKNSVETVLVDIIKVQRMEDIYLQRVYMIFIICGKRKIRKCIIEIFVLIPLYFHIKIMV